MDTLFLDENSVLTILNGVGWPKVIDAIGQTFYEEALNQTISPPKTIIQVETHSNDYRVMPSFMSRFPDYIGTKIVCACPENPGKYNLPLVMGTYLLNDARNQRTLMLAGARTTTAWRTAAATAVAVGALTLHNKRGSQKVGLIGCGLQAYSHVSALDVVLDIEEFLVADISSENAKRFQKYFIDKGDPRITIATKRAIFDNCHIVVTMTPTTKPHIFKEDLPDRKMVLAAVGGDSDRKMEIAPEILSVADHYCDSYEQVSHTGTVMRALERGIIQSADLKSIGDYMIGKVKEDTNRKPKIFLSTGVALEDLAINILVYENRHLLEE